MANGLTLSFHLAGINNQNFLMRDDQTGTFWQQISGSAVAGPLRGAQLERVYSDEVTFALWRKEAPEGTVLKPVEQYAGEYEKKDWEAQIAKLPTVLDFPQSGLPARELVLGVAAFGARRAYPVKRIVETKLIEDRLGSESILIVLGADGKSVRVFQGRLRGENMAPEYYRTTEGAGLLVDSETGSEWDFGGCAVSGKRMGACLQPVYALKDYWFDWRNYHPDTTVFRR